MLSVKRFIAVVGRHYTRLQAWWCVRGSLTRPRKTREAWDRRWIYKYSRRRGAICPGHLVSLRGLPDCNPITSHTLSLSASTLFSRPLTLSFHPLCPSLLPPSTTLATPLSGRHWVSCNLDRVTTALNCAGILLLQVIKSWMDIHIYIYQKHCN